MQNKEKISKSRKDRYTRKEYGISLEEYNKKFIEQTTCEICGITAENSPMPTLNYDHCHTTGKFRGILCRSCNQAIGLLGDTASNLKKAYDYLLKAESCH